MKSFQEFQESANVSPSVQRAKERTRDAIAKNRERNIRRHQDHLNAPQQALDAIENERRSAAEREKMKKEIKRELKQ